MIRSRVRIVAVAVAGVVAAANFCGCSTYDKLRKDADQLSHPDDGPPPLTDQQKIQLIDSLRAKGSFEAARDRFTDIAKTIADQISTRVPDGPRWSFDTTSEFGRISYNFGLPCDQLPGDIALRPQGRPIAFDPPLTGDAFKTAIEVIRGEAAKHGATKGNSLFDESRKSEYDVQGNGYEFRLLQAQLGVLTITGDCYLLQKAIDSPPGTLPA